MIAHVEALRALGASDDALDYVATHATAQDAWDACHHPNWMAWLVARLDQRQGVLIACLCARSVAHRSGRFQAEIESLLCQIEAWAWGADVDMEPVRKRLWSIYRAHVVRSAAAAFFAAATTTNNDAADDAAVAASVAADYAADYAADPADLCDMIRSAVPVCPLEVAS